MTQEQQRLCIATCVGHRRCNAQIELVCRVVAAQSRGQGAH
jgi:hypothetical protein